jgi:2-polyprenyl-3-methyl-5-hydroxy-6-metoxy-1,4-benzoquinol methylase
MPDLTESRAYWDGGYHWRHGGDEWSDWWAGPEAQWQVTLYPRVEPFLPAHRLLEIAPGYGRWTQFLRDHCDELVAIDLSARCVEACRRRFRKDRRLSFHVNDGKSLSAARDDSIDFVFSFDSLVHVEQEIVDAYIVEIARVLTVDGVAFLHHSNMAAYGVEAKEPHWRSTSVSAETVSDSAAAAGLNCFRQELVRWGEEHQFLNDSFTWIARPDSEHDTPREVLANPTFMDETRQARERYVKQESPGERRASWFRRARSVSRS